MLALASRVSRLPSYQHLWHLDGDYAAAFRQTKLEAMHGKVRGAEPVEEWQAVVMFTN